MFVRITWSTWLGVNGSLAGESANLIGITSTLLVVVSAMLVPGAGGNPRIVIWLASSDNPSAAVVPETLTVMPGRSASGITAMFNGVICVAPSWTPKPYSPRPSAK